MSDLLGLHIPSCRRRQDRLRERMQQRQLDAVLVTQREHVQWLTGLWIPPVFQTVATLTQQGHCVLVAPTEVTDAAADEVVAFEAKWLSTLRNDQKQAAIAKLLTTSFGGVRGSVGTEFSTFPGYLADHASFAWLDCEADLYALRRYKEADELAKLRKAIAATGQMYGVAREILEPGISELEMFNQLQRAAVEVCGEMLTGTGNDYQCGSRGGPPRQREAVAGELYILDLGPAFRGYFADNCRTIAVSQVSDLQQQAWEHVTGVFRHVQSVVRPGKNAHELFLEVKEMLSHASVGVFNHHLGHGIGLFPHEAPHLNPNWDDVFQEGDVFAVEPGIYAPQLNAGMRIENNYRVTGDGVELLSDFDLALR